MSDLLVTRVLPNPPGKDRRPPLAPPNEKLVMEFMEFANVGRTPVDLQGVSAWHMTFNQSCSRTGEDQLMIFTGILQPGYSVRVHTGTGTAYVNGTVTHVFAARSNYAWNNVCGDVAVLRDAAGSLVDWAQYERNPPEGVVLNRVLGTNKLSASASALTA
jgi:hypothetical protein